MLSSSKFSNFFSPGAHQNQIKCLNLYNEDSPLTPLPLKFLLRRVDSNHRPLGYEPNKLPLLYRAIYLYKRKDLHQYGSVTLYQPLTGLRLSNSATLVFLAFLICQRTNKDFLLSLLYLSIRSCSVKPRGN